MIKTQKFCLVPHIALWARSDKKTQVQTQPNIWSSKTSLIKHHSENEFKEKWVQWTRFSTYFIYNNSSPEDSIYKRSDEGQNTEIEFKELGFHVWKTLSNL